MSIESSISGFNNFIYESRNIKLSEPEGVMGNYHIGSSDEKDSEHIVAFTRNGIVSQKLTDWEHRRKTGIYIPISEGHVTNGVKGLEQNVDLIDKTQSVLRDFFERRASSRPQSSLSSKNHNQGPGKLPKHPRAITMTKADQKGPTIRIHSGTSSCLDYSYQCPQRKEITLVESVYEVTHHNSPALLMTKTDFETLKRVCHRGAFGSDYRELTSEDLPQYGLQGTKEEKYMLLWKLPADLKQIKAYVVDQSLEYTESDVGRYFLNSDWGPQKLSQNTRGILSFLQSVSGKKVRTDFSDGITPSTHHLILSTDGTLVPGISTAFFFSNFNNPQQAEIEIVKGFINTLADLGFGAYLCNSQQHMVIIGAYQDQAISPQELANLLQTEETVRGEVLEAVWLAATERSFDGKNMKKQVDPWMKGFIKRFS